LNRSEAQRVVSRFPHLKILVLGDFMLDQFLWGRVDRISPEAPVPVVDADRETFSLGGAGNVVRNLTAMGSGVVPVGVIGQDWIGDRIVQLIEEQGVPSESLFRSDRPTTLKTRVIAHQQQVVRVDREDRTLIESKLETILTRAFLELLPSVDGVIISDYSKGTITPNLLANILPSARKQKKLVCLDPKVRYFSSYSPVSIMTPNQAEAASVLGYPIVTRDDLEAAAHRILKMIDCEALLITRGENGMALFADGKMTLVPARAREVYDVTGAGDTVISILCLALAAGAELLDAVHLTNTAAGIVVGKIGTATVTPDELINSLEGA
jgi:D-beta-D-heptose 7-phosphate kinase/D-beta-D-heptose 1-phosphate adenosyltransferase